VPQQLDGYSITSPARAPLKANKAGFLGDRVTAAERQSPTRG
jgi:hypothetical protein